MIKRKGKDVPAAAVIARKRTAQNYIDPAND
jgi:hypothetical protein